MNSIAMMIKYLGTFTRDSLEEMMNDYWLQLLVDIIIHAKGLLSSFETIF